MPDDDDLKKYFERAAEIAKVVPSALQESAFNRALDALLPKAHHKMVDQPPEHPVRRSRRKAKKTQDSSRSPAGRRVGRTTSGRPGPKAALEQLLPTSFWAQPRTISDLQDHLRTSRGYTYKLGELSPSLVRLLRDGKLERSKNKDNQYEYKRR